MTDPYNICLGTAMWGWTISKEMAFRLMDLWYEKGQRSVDIATNYPINKISSDFRKTEKWLKEWIQLHNIEDLRIMIKVGATSNNGSPENNLSPSFLSINHQHYLDLYGSQFDCMMIHWDNRSDAIAIKDTIDCMQDLCMDNQKLGFSGIKHPKVYLPLLKNLAEKPYLQAKNNIIQSHLPFYKEILPYVKPIVYGLSGGGLKLSEDYKASSSAKNRGLDTASMQSKIQDINIKIEAFNKNNPNIAINNMHQLGMLLSLLDKSITGLLIGPSKTEHILDSLSFMEKLNSNLVPAESIKIFFDE